MMEKNDETKRVGAYLSIGEGVVRFLGYGVFLGYEIPTEEARGVAELCRMMGSGNPKIQLDNGDIVWGCECWWGNEEKIKREIDDLKEQGYEIVIVSIKDARASQDSKNGTN